MSSERLDVVRMQFDGVTIAAMGAALLAGVVIALKYDLAPFGVFAFAACYVVLVAFVDMASPFSLLRPFSLFVRGGVGDFGATVGAHFTQHTALAVFGHRFVADRAQNFDAHAFGTHLVRFAKVVRAFAADLAGNADTARFCLEAGSARHASGVFDWLAQGCDRRGWLAALSARNKGGAVAIATNAVVSAVYFAFDAFVLCHTAIIPQLPDLEKCT